MKRFFDMLFAALFLVLLVVIAARLDRVSNRDPEGRPIINDGDTISIDHERIRLLGLDAPELSQICRLKDADWPCGKKAHDALRDLIKGQVVKCTGWERDRYGRLLATCTAGSVNLNQALVLQGWAVAYGDYDAEEAEAKRARRGIWASEFDLPGNWRASHARQPEDAHSMMRSIGAWLEQMIK